MSLWRKKSFLVLIVFLMAGCATTQPTYIPLPSEAPKAINSSNVVILSTQHEITAEVDKSQVATAMGGGLIPALIDVVIERSRSKSAEEVIRPVREALIDYDIGAELRNSSGKRLSAIPWLKVQKIEILSVARADLVTNLLASGSEDVLVIINPSYTLTSDFSALKTNAVLEVYPRSSNLKKFEKPDGGQSDRPLPIYKNQASHMYSLPSNPTDMTAASQEWAKNNGAWVREGLKQGVQAISDILLNGLNNPHSLSGSSSK